MLDASARELRVAPLEVSMKPSPTQIEGEYRNVGLFVDNAKTYIQLATGALLLSVTFQESVSGKTGPQVKQLYLWLPWLCWLISILAGATYQYCAAKYLEELEIRACSLFYSRAKPFFALKRWVQKPYQLYAVLLISFYGGTIWFVIAAIHQLLTAPK